MKLLVTVANANAAPQALSSRPWRYDAATGTVVNSSVCEVLLPSVYLASWPWDVAEPNLLFGSVAAALRRPTGYLVARSDSPSEDVVRAFDDLRTEWFRADRALAD